MFDKLELSTETIRELTGAELEHVAGGNPTGPQPTPPVYAVTNYYCPSGPTWTMNCQFDSLGC